MIQDKTELEESYPKYTYQENIFVKGMEFLKFETEDGQERYFVHYADGTIDSTQFTDVYPSGNLTIGKKENGKEVMIDDDGIHNSW